MGDIKILDWIGVFNPYTLKIDINKVCDIFANNKGEKIYKCYKVELINENEAKINNDTRIVNEKDIICILEKVKSIKIIEEKDKKAPF